MDGEQSSRIQKKRVHSMNESEIEKALESEMMNFDANDPKTMKWMALERYGSEFRSGYEQIFSEVRGMVVSDDGTILESESFRTDDEAQSWAKEKIAELFDEGKQDVCSVRITWTETNNRTLFDSAKYRKVKAQRRETHESSYRHKLEREETFKHRATKWEEACLWCSQNGIRIRKEKDGSIGHNKRMTVIDKVIKANLVIEFNERFPEFRISDEYIAFNKKKVVG